MISWKKIIKNCRGVIKCNDGMNRMKDEEQRDTFRTLLGLKENDIMNKQGYTIISQIQQVFSDERIKPQHFVLKEKKLDLIGRGCIYFNVSVFLRC